MGCKTPWKFMTFMTRHLHWAEKHESPSNITKYHTSSSNITLAMKMTLQNMRHIFWKRLKRYLQCGADPTMIRQRSEHEPAVRNPSNNWAHFSRSPFCVEKWYISLSGYHSKFHDEKWQLNWNQIRHLPKKNTVQLECNFMKYCACHEKWQLDRTKYRTWNENWMCNLSATSPNTAPATKSILFFCSTILWLCDVVRISEVSQLNFLW